MSANPDLDRAILTLIGRADIIAEDEYADAIDHARRLAIGFDLDVVDLAHRGRVAAEHTVAQIADGLDPVRAIGGQWEIGLFTGLLLAQQRATAEARA